jgi:hypothetical protein
VDSLGIVYGLELNLHRVYKITPTGPTTADIALLAGSTEGYADGQGSAARFNFHPQSGLCVDRFGNVYVGEFNNGSVRKITPSGLVSTIAGNGTNAASTGAETNTQLYEPGGVFVTTNGVVYVATATSIRKISPVDASLANAGNNDVFVVKYNSAGTLLWSSRLGGVGDDQSYAIITDSSGNIFVCGGFPSSLTVYNADGSVFTTLTPVGTMDVFIVKYNTSGTPSWVKTITQNSTQFSFYSYMDSLGNLFITGSTIGINSYDTNGTLRFSIGGTAVTPTTDSSGNLFVATTNAIMKYNASGTFLWSASCGGDFNNLNLGSNGDVFVYGQYTSSTTTIRSSNSSLFSTLTNSMNGKNDLFLAKYNTNGICQWVTRIGGVNDEFGVSRPKIDLNGNVFIRGIYMSGTATIYNADGSVHTTLALSGDRDAMFMKYNINGTCQWASRIVSTGTDQSSDFALDANGNLYVCGNVYGLNSSYYNGDGSIFPKTVTGNFYVGNVIKYNTSGTIQWISYIYDTDLSAPNSLEMYVDTSGNIFVGFYSYVNTIITNANGSVFTKTTGIGINDLFVVKYNNDGIVQWVKKLGGNNNDYQMRLTGDPSGNIAVSVRTESNPLTIRVE